MSEIIVEGKENKPIEVEVQKFVTEDTMRAILADQCRMKEGSFLQRNVAPFIAIITVISVFGMFYTILWNKDLITTNNKDILIYILGVLSSIISGIFGFYFGSSQSSNRKDELLRIPPPPNLP